MLESVFRLNVIPVKWEMVAISEIRHVKGLKPYVSRRELNTEVLDSH